MYKQSISGLYFVPDSLTGYRLEVQQSPGLFKKRTVFLSENNEKGQKGETELAAWSKYSISPY